MVDYDVMVFVRLKPPIVHMNTMHNNVIYQDGSIALMVIPKREYDSCRLSLIMKAQMNISEIQLIRPRRA